MYCLAGLDDLSSGAVFIGDQNVTALGERARTRLRREQIGFVFQSYNLVPTLTAIENIVLPERLAHQPVDQGWLDDVIGRVDLGNRLHHPPPSCREASSSGWRWPGRARRSSDCSAAPSTTTGRAS
jgi:putative ABC transport system ATP-binding protein